MDRKYGWRPDVPDQRDYRFEVTNEHHDLVAATSAIDLRKGMPPVWDQNQLGSCTSFAASAAFEYLQRKQKASWEFEPSQLFIYYNERVEEGTVASDAGAMVRTSAKVLNKYGTTRIQLWSYNVAKFAVKPPIGCYQNAILHKVLLYKRVAQDINSMKAVLVSGLPFIFGFTVYESFESDAVASTGIVPMPLPTEKALGGHAVACVGADDKRQAVLVRNSWGSGWGEGGYFWLPYAYITNNNLADDFWVFQHLST